MAGKLLSILFLLFGFSALAQSFQYSYIDPCTGSTISITVPATGVTMFYAGQFRTFSTAEILAGGYESWVASVNASLPSGTNPCSGTAVNTTTNINQSVASNTAMAVVNITSVIQMASSLTNTTSGIANSASSTSSTSSNENNNSNQNGQNNTGSNQSSGQTNTSGSSTGSTGGSSGGATGNSNPSNSPGSTGSNNTGGSPMGQGEGQTSQNSPENTASQNEAAGGNQTIASATGGQSEKGSKGGGNTGRGAIVGTGDIVVIRNGSDVLKSNDNYKFNVSFTHLNTKQTFAKGALLNYTTGINQLSVTLYGSYRLKNFTAIGSNTFMTNFREEYLDNVSLLAAQKTGKVTWMGGANVTGGYVGKETFLNFAVIGGGFTNFKGGKSFSANALLLGVYSPYIFYYDGIWYKSGLLLVPMANTDFKLTDKFKWSISFSGVYQINDAVLNYQVLTGTKILL
jgi:hypothetical protein